MVYELMWRYLQTMLSRPRKSKIVKWFSLTLLNLETHRKHYACPRNASESPPCCRLKWWPNRGIMVLVDGKVLRVRKMITHSLLGKLASVAFGETMHLFFRSLRPKPDSPQLFPAKVRQSYNQVPESRRQLKIISLALIFHRAQRGKCYIFSKRTCTKPTTLISWW